MLNNFVNFELLFTKLPCWTKGRCSTAVAEDLRPTAPATVAEDFIGSFLSFFSKMEAEMQAFLCFHYTGATCL